MALRVEDGGLSGLDIEMLCRSIRLKSGLPARRLPADL